MAGKPVNGPVVVANPWQKLRQYTAARIALGRAGTSLPTAPHLDFQLAHARARNAVHHQLDVAALAATLAQKGLDVVCLHSAAANRPVYLQRPDKGRRLDPASRDLIEKCRPASGENIDIVFVIADGLSALAIEENVVPFLDAMLPRLPAERWRIGPFVIVEEGRVAVGDEIGEVLGAELVVVLIGERPGLSSPDSMGLYLTFKPHVGATDERRNCISNVRREGLSYETAAHKLLYLLTEARKRQLSGVNLKDEAESAPELITPHGTNFLLDDAE